MYEYDISLSLMGLALKVRKGTVWLFVPFFGFLCQGQGWGVLQVASILFLESEDEVRYRTRGIHRVIVDVERSGLK